MGSYTVRAAGDLTVPTGSGSVVLPSVSTWRTSRFGDAYWRCGDTLKIASGGAFLASLYTWGASRGFPRDAGGGMRWRGDLLLAAAQRDDEEPMGLASRLPLPVEVLDALLQTGCPVPVELPPNAVLPVEGATVAALSAAEDRFAAVPWEPRFDGLFGRGGRVYDPGELPPVTGTGTGTGTGSRGSSLWPAVLLLGAGAFLLGKGRRK